MEKVAVAFFKAWEGELDDKLIDIVTGFQGFSHCELVITKNHTIGAHYINDGVVECFYKDIYSDPRWSILEKEVGEGQRRNIIQKGISYLGRGYDTKGVVCTALLKKPLCINKKETWCSKLVAKCIKHELDIGSIDLMPNELFKMMLDKGWRISHRKKLSAPLEKDKEIDRFGRIKIKKTR
jgi:hypothetical protein